MKIPYKLKPHLVASRDETRYVLMNVKVDENFISATDGKRLIMALPEKDDLERDETKEAFLDREVCKIACKKQTKANKYLEGVVTLLKEGWSKAYKDWESELSCRVSDKMHFPNVCNVIPDDERTFSININTKLLHELSQALGDDIVTLWIDTTSTDVKKATIVLAHKMKDRFGLIMPTRDTEQLESNLAFQKALKTKKENQSK